MTDIVQHTIEDPAAFCAWWQRRSSSDPILDEEIVLAALSAGLIVTSGVSMFLTSLGRRFAKINAAQRY